MTRKYLVLFYDEPVRMYHVHHENGVRLGDILAKEDGFYDFWPDYTQGRGGYWPAYILRELADKLDELNAPWQAQLEELMI
jgi:hypothetical protein